MKIIDAHLHLFSEDSAEEMARQVGHYNNVDHLREVYGELHIAHGVVMGNHSLELRRHDYPTDLFHYCVGLDSLVLRRGSHIPEDLPDQVEEHLKRENCCGVKLSPGYNRIWLSDPVYEPVYRLAERYDKPVAVHMGLTAHPRAHLKYSHPLALDEAAAVLAEILRRAKEEPEALHAAPASTPVGRPDEIAAARRPVVRYAFPEG